MLEFAKKDEEVAYVLATEMAHNILEHPKKLRMTATMDGIIDNLIRIHPDLSTMNGMSGVKPFPAELDAAADSLAMYLLARAGYGIEGAPTFWQSLATAYPASSVPNGYTAIHPATAMRISAMKKAISDIRNKQANKQPLIP
jgi:predicted Zn-dependent protease